MKAQRRDSQTACRSRRARLLARCPFRLKGAARGRVPRSHGPIVCGVPLLPQPNTPVRPDPYALPLERRPIVRSVLAALAVVIPLGLGGAVSPVMLTEQTVLLAGPDGGRAGVRYAAGVVLTTLVIVVAIMLFGRAISLPTEPHLDATLDLVLGLVLVNVAVLVLVSGRRRGGSPSRKGDDDRGASGARQARAAFAFGVFAMATNVTTLALIAPAAKEISRLTLRSRLKRRSSSCSSAWCPCLRGCPSP